MNPCLIFRSLLAAATLTFAIAAASAQPASAALRSLNMPFGSDAAPKGYTHIICYEVSPVNPFTAVTVALFDQFFPGGFKATLNQTNNACTPARKKLRYRHPLKGFRPNGHFVCYPFNPPSYVELMTAYFNQLEKNSTTWVFPYLLCVPTYKYGSGPPPKTYNHLMIYDGSLGGVVFTNPLQATTVTLYDQFFPNGFTTQLGNPILLLTPTRKVYSKGHKTANNGHWIVYSFTAPNGVNSPKDYINQLEKNSLTAFYPNWLMVPTYKYPPTGMRVRVRMQPGLLMGRGPRQ